MFFIKFGKFLSIISTDTLSVPFFLSSPGNPTHTGIVLLMMVSTVFETLFKFLHSFFFLFFGLDSLNLPLFKFANSLFSSLILLLSPSGEFFIFIIVLLNSKTPM